MVSVDVPEPVIDAGLKLAVMPVSWPRNVALKPTAPLNPFTPVTVIVAVT
jgi:hypothetical protein